MADADALQELLEDDGAFDKSFYRNPARIQTISRAIQAAATNHRSSIKKKARVPLLLYLRLLYLRQLTACRQLIKSIKSKWYIGKLATALTSKTDLKITALILQRLAFIVRSSYCHVLLLDMFAALPVRERAGGRARREGQSVLEARQQEACAGIRGRVRCRRVCDVRCRSRTLPRMLSPIRLMKTYLTRDEAAYKVGSKTKIRIYRPDELPAFQTDADKRAKDVVLAAPEDDEDLEDEDGDGDGAGGGDGDGEDDEEAAQ